MPRKEPFPEVDLEYTYQNILITIRESDKRQQKEIVQDALGRDTTS
jgi:hypothetical protein